MTRLGGVPTAVVLGVAVAVVVSGCGSAEQAGAASTPSVSAPASATTGAGQGGAASSLDDAAMPTAAPAFQAHFTDPIYEDQSDELASFGTDEGSGLLAEWAGRRGELSRRSSVADLLRDSGFEWAPEQLAVAESPGIPAPGGQVDAAVIVIGAGFTLLRLTGHIDPAGKELTLRALDTLLARYDSPPQLVRQREDLQSWHD